MFGKEYFGFLFSPVYSIWAVRSVYAAVRVALHKFLVVLLKAMQNCKDLLDRGTDQPQSILIIAIRDVKWMHTVSLCIFFGWVFPDRNHEGERHFQTPANTVVYVRSMINYMILIEYIPFENLILATYVLAMEATLISLEGFPDSREALICTFISCCLTTVLLSHISFATVLKSGDSLLTRIRKASTRKL